MLKLRCFFCKEWGMFVARNMLEMDGTLNWTQSSTPRFGSFGSFFCLENKNRLCSKSCGIDYCWGLSQCTVEGDWPVGRRITKWIYKADNLLVWSGLGNDSGPKGELHPTSKEENCEWTQQMEGGKNRVFRCFRSFFWLIRAANAPLTQHFVIFCGIFKAAQKWPQKVPQRSTKGCAKGATRRWPKNATKSHKVSFLRRFWCVYMRKNDKNHEIRLLCRWGRWGN